MGLVISEQRDYGSFKHRTLIDVAHITERKDISWRLMASYMVWSSLTWTSH